MAIKLSRSNPAVKALLAATFPDYSGRKILGKLARTPVFVSPYWDGGSRDEAVAVRLSDGATTGLPSFAPWDLPGGGASITVPDGCVLAVRSIFCGRLVGVTFYIGAAVVPRLGSEIAGLLAC